jgi:hypothetical protein
LLSLLDEERGSQGAHVDAIVPPVNIKRLAELGRAVRDLDSGPAAAPVSHPRDALCWLQGANQYGCRNTFGLGHDVQAMVHTIDEIDVRATRATIHGAIALGRSRSRV